MTYALKDQTRNLTMAIVIPPILALLVGRALVGVPQVVPGFLITIACIAVEFVFLFRAFRVRAAVFGVVYFFVMYWLIFSLAVIAGHWSSAM